MFRSKEIRDQYYSNPTKCQNCNKPLPMKLKTHKFCSRTCLSLFKFKDKERVVKKLKPCKNCGNLTFSAKFCHNFKCASDFTFKEAYIDWLNLDESKFPFSYSIKRKVLERDEYKCVECGIKDYNSKPIVLELDHIDGNFQNNKPDNVRLLCPNCHSQTPNFRSKNRGKGRTILRKNFECSGI